MFVIVDDRPIVTAGYASAFEREGFASLELQAGELEDWLSVAAEADLEAVEGFLLGEGEDRLRFPEVIRRQCKDAPVLYLEERTQLDSTLELFSAGADDVLRKPVHVKEILARVGAIRRRMMAETENVSTGAIEVFFDGRDPIIGGEVMVLPRRERRILEYFARNMGRRVTKAQLFNAVYGVTNDAVDECVVESHVSKLRKKLRNRLGYDAIESTRYIGYMLKSDLPVKLKVVARERGTVQASAPVERSSRNAMLRDLAVVSA
ncbi:response regulator transcription factor [Roseibium aestuarii]|uniref:Response regulator transcription factor n=1 Tax=Roseibium aestuarii TaxID=2600299 RepID=A0ABW4JXD4_9HYPH|nr:response regulator transcription factor [Roseibium aestuarii]